MCFFTEETVAALQAYYGQTPASLLQCFEVSCHLQAEHATSSAMIVCCGVAAA